MDGAALPSFSMLDLKCKSRITLVQALELSLAG